jgi:hypothetical protein
MAKIMKKMSKAQNGKSSATADSTTYYTKKLKYDADKEDYTKRYGYPNPAYDRARKETDSTLGSLARQLKKGKPGYDPNGFPKQKSGGKIIKKKAQSGIEAALEAKTAERNTKGPALREGQVKRMTRVFNANPERGVKVAKRMLKRAVNSSSVMKKGGMLKRADGSYSKRGLWDNIRANKGSGKKPTAAMLKQERKIKSKTK